MTAVALMGALALAAAATPAGARAPSGTASASFVQVGPCSVQVTYAWSGFRGKDVTAYFGAFYRLDLTARYWVFDGASADPAGGSATETFDLSGQRSHDCTRAAASLMSVGGRWTALAHRP
jgi:hypothetical protein